MQHTEGVEPRKHIGGGGGAVNVRGVRGMATTRKKHRPHCRTTAAAGSRAVASDAPRGHRPPPGRPWRHPAISGPARSARRAWPSPSTGFRRRSLRRWVALLRLAAPATPGVALHGPKRGTTCWRMGAARRPRCNRGRIQPPNLDCRASAGRSRTPCGPSSLTAAVPRRQPRRPCARRACRAPPAASEPRWRTTQRRLPLRRRCSRRSPSQRSRRGPGRPARASSGSAHTSRSTARDPQEGVLPQRGRSKSSRPFAAVRRPTLPAAP
mmetsp:Transcript_99716/g.287915  ORF Transcript_99716/g.287915 Transcript_99716/m.287915 type:complete len:267 (+) Transcript_99716:119-919(+)